VEQQQVPLDLQVQLFIQTEQPMLSLQSELQANPYYQEDLVLQPGEPFLYLLVELV
jgi:hypothetical protein